MESVMYQVHQCFDRYERHMMGVVFKSSFVLKFLNKGKHLSFNSHYFE